MMHPIDTTAIRRREDVASPGPWTADPWIPGPPYPNPAIVVSQETGGVIWCYGDNAGNNAAFAAAARQDVPALCAEVERLRELVRTAYLKGFRDGDRTSFDSPERCWEWSSSKKEV